MNEKTKLELEKEQAELKAIEKENRILSFLLPIVGGAAFILGLVGFILTVTSGQVGIIIFYAILFLLGLLGLLYGALLIIRRKNPNFLKKNKVEQEDTVLAD